MLGKLLKYEMKGTGRTLVPFYGLMLLLAVITRIFNGINIHKFSTLGEIAMGIVAFAYGLTMASVMMLTAFLVIQRFYRTVYGDEGYLTHTLPVKSRDIIISKTVSAFLWIVLSAVVAFASVMIIGYQAGMWNDLIYTINYWRDEIMLSRILGSGANMLLLGAFALISTTLIGSLGAFIGVSFIVNTVTGIIGNSGIIDSFMNIDMQNSAQAIAGFNYFVWLMIGFYIVKIAVYYGVTNHLMTKKLNLE